MWGLLCFVPAMVCAIVLFVFIQGTPQPCHSHNNQPLPLLVLKVESAQLWLSQVKKCLSMLQKHSDCFKPYVQLHQCDTLSEVDTMLPSMLLRSLSSLASLDESFGDIPGIFAKSCNQGNPALVCSKCARPRQQKLPSKMLINQKLISQPDLDLWE